MLEDLAAVRSGFVGASLFVTWVALGVVVLIASNLHVRLTRLERAQPAGEASQTPYSKMLGVDLGSLIGDASLNLRNALVVFVTRSCPSCDRVLRELASKGVPSIVGWIDDDSEEPPLPPGNSVLIRDAATLSARLGIRVTPFAMVTDAQGRTIRAAPIESLNTLNRLVRPGPHKELH